MTGNLLLESLMAVPAMAIGYYLGSLLLPHIDAHQFRKISIYVLLGTGLLGIIVAIITLR
jgi:uncharacterized membrane protein YfcA